MVNLTRIKKEFMDGDIAAKVFEKELHYLEKEIKNIELKIVHLKELKQSNDYKQDVKLFFNVKEIEKLKVKSEYVKEHNLWNQMNQEQKQYIINQYIDEIKISSDNNHNVSILNIIFNKNEIENIGYMFRNDCFDMIINVNERDIILSNYIKQQEKNDYTTMYNSVVNVNNKGFYIGRYEAGTSEVTLSGNVKWENASTGSSNSQGWTWQNGSFVSSKVTGGKITSKAGEIPYYHADYTTATEMSRNMISTEYVQSGLVTGTMWDMMMKFMSTSSNYSDLKSSNWGNYNNNTAVSYTAGRGRYLEVNSSNGSTSNALESDNNYHYGIGTTASRENVKQKNIYMGTYPPSNLLIFWWVGRILHSSSSSILSIYFSILWKNRM